MSCSSVQAKNSKYQNFVCIITLFFFIRNQFIRNEFSGGKKFKKLENWDKGNLRNFVYIRFHEIQEITRFILYKKAYSLFGSLSFIGLLACSFVVFLVSLYCQSRGRGCQFSFFPSFVSAFQSICVYPYPH